MADIYIATPTQADYDALMRLAEAAGFEWLSGKKPTVLDLYEEYAEDGGQVIQVIVESKELMQCDRKYFEKEGHKIETIPNLADIKAIWKVSRENRDVFTMKHRLPPHYKSARKLYVICDEYSGTYTTKENEIYEALAVEYKPKESEVMPEKVKLPKEIYEVLRNIYGIPEVGEEDSPLRVISDLTDFSKEKDGYGVELGRWLAAGGAINQWKLIDALRNGYEAEPEQLYYVRFAESTESFLNVNNETGRTITSSISQVCGYKTQFTMPEIETIDPRYKAFAVKVEEVDGNE